MSKEILLAVRKRIKERGYTLERLAGEIGSTQSALTQALSGNPSLGKLEAIAEKLKISLSELVLLDEGGSTITCPHCGKSIKIKTEISVTKG